MPPERDRVAPGPDETPPAPSPPGPSPTRTLRARLLVGILAPVLALVALNAWTLYDHARDSADIAYDRTLLASAKAIGETLETTGDGRVVARVPYAALEAFETDGRSRIVYKVLGFRGELVSGYDDLPTWRGRIPDRGPYAALVDFYDLDYRGEPVRAAVLLQPVVGPGGSGIATIQVAETLELRDALAGRMLAQTLWSQALLLGVIAAVVVVVVQRATQPVREISAGIEARADGDLQPIDGSRAPAELLPLVDAINRTMARLSRLMEDQKRFLRDASHQLRTPLAVLKVQLQSARRGDVGPREALDEVAVTVDRAVRLANQMLALARAEQLHRPDTAPVVDWAEPLRAVALDLAPLIAGKSLDFSLDAAAAPVRAHDWALRELVRNLLSNAVRYTPAGGTLAVRLEAGSAQATLTIADSGPGIDAETRARLFQPFSAGQAAGGDTHGSGLGLAICREIVRTLGGRIELVDSPDRSGLDAVVELPLASSREPGADAPAARRATAD